MTSAEARERSRRVGPNALPEAAPVPLWRRIARQLKSPLIYILLFALAFDLVTWTADGASGIPTEALAIGLVLALNAGLGAFQEHRSEQARAKLKELALPRVWVLRDGALVAICSRDLVPGDVVRIEAGDRVPADGRLLEGVVVMVDEAVLTGESVPVEKAIDAELMSGTLLVRGSGMLEVTRTGSSSAMGRLATMLGEIETGKTPLERRLDALGRRIARWVGALAAVLVVLGVAIDGLSQIEETIFFAVALAVAAVPEGMPAVVTLALALGVQRMARRNAVVRRLAAVEALGSVTVIATDKTGTLTENRMQVRAVHAPDEGEALRAMVLANDADLRSGAGDPLERGLLEHARARGLDVEAVRAAAPRASERPFDSAWKFHRVTVEHAARRVSYLKGAPEVLLERSRLSETERTAWRERAEEDARAGYRLLALARGDGEAEDGLDLVGLVALWDPPRPEIADAMRSAQNAGVRVLMITGDHPATAAAVARAIGMERTEVATGEDVARAGSQLRDLVGRVGIFARVAPEQKLAIVDALQARGELVAVTGDGVNDAPALKRADVGIAMGVRGSDVAREVADLVLLDDDFASIVGAIEEGRSIYENIQKFVRFMFSTNFALVLLVVLGAAGAYAAGLREPTGMLLLPLSAIQLLWTNLVCDGPPALALALDRNRDLMSCPPRPPESPLLDAASMRFVVVTGLVKALGGGALLVVTPLLGYGTQAVRTIVFLFESLAQLAFAYPSRSTANEPASNWVLHAVVLGSVALQLACVAVPGLRALLGLESLDRRALLLAIASTLVTFAAVELVRRWTRARARAEARAPIERTADRST